MTLRASTGHLDAPASTGSIQAVPDATGIDEAAHEQALIETSLACISALLRGVDTRHYRRAATLRQYVAAIYDVLRIPDSLEAQTTALVFEISRATLPDGIKNKLIHGHELEPTDLITCQLAEKHTTRVVDALPNAKKIRSILPHISRRYDGAGLPPSDAVRGERIPMAARACRACRDYLNHFGLGRSHEDVMEALRGDPGIYDPQILQTIDELEAPKPPKELDLQPCRVSDLEKGMIAGDDIRGQDGSILVTEGSSLNSESLSRIREHHRQHRVRQPLWVIKPKQESA
jgi:hypothetical protein